MIEHTKLSPALNPWTNKSKVKGEGMLNSIIEKYLNEDNTFDNTNCMTSQEQEYVKLAENIKKDNSFKETLDDSIVGLFELKKRCAKLDQILEWIEKVETRWHVKNEPNENTEEVKAPEKVKITPIDSSFIYLPIYSGTVFHEILKDCSAKDKRKTIGEYKNPKIKEFLQELASFPNFNQILEKNIL